jgi:hypothetical protein
MIAGGWAAQLPSKAHLRVPVRVPKRWMGWPAERVSWPTTTIPQMPSAPPDAASLVSASNALVADLVIEIGGPAFAALRAPFLDHLQSYYPNDGFT